jgi:hypothetical protein
MLYSIHFRRDYNTPKDYSLVGEPTYGLDTLERAKAARVVSGDLVVSWKTGEIIKSEEWLFDWEKEDPNCYAQRAIAFGK